jgi:hypothetical protein
MRPSSGTSTGSTAINRAHGLQITAFIVFLQFVLRYCTVWPRVRGLAQVDRSCSAVATAALRQAKHTIKPFCWASR